MCTHPTEHDYAKLSSHLSQVMDAIGASEDIRGKHWEVAICHEIAHTASIDMSRGAHISIYRFGSSIEGTTTPGLHSDVDILTCQEEFPVAESVEDVPKDGHSFLMVTHDDIKPGYVLLQSVYNGVPQTTSQRECLPGYEYADHLGRIVRRHVFLINEHRARNGPAVTTPEGKANIEQDTVLAFRCKKTPNTNKSWIHRNSKWPLPEQLRTIESYGCFLVGVGHPKSQHKSIEWRISFSLQERDLMASMNPTQHKCYILLKMIKRDIIHPKAGGKSISSYHCKTCLFHIIENNDSFLWSPTTLIQGVRLCLELMLQWVREENCPNFFIPEENMFDRMDTDTLKEVAVILDEILSNGFEFLMSLNCDNVCSLLYKSMSGTSLGDLKKGMKIAPDSVVLFSYVSRSLYFRYRFLKRFCHASAPSDCLTQALALLQYLQNTNSFTDQTKRDVRMAVDSITPHIHLQIAQCNFTSSIMSGDITHPSTIPNTSLHHVQASRECDVISTLLALASWYLRLEHFEECELTLQSCESILTQDVVSMCGCVKDVSSISDRLERMLLDNNLSTKDFRRHYTAGCMVFLPCQSNLVPRALHYEIYRSAYTPSGSRNEKDDGWFDWIVVDSLIYLLFLEYTLNYQTDNHHRIRPIVGNLRYAVEKRRNLGHRETGYNLLGWVYTQENRMNDAWHCFCTSLRMRPLHNAAKWHMALLIYTFLQ